MDERPAASWHELPPWVRRLSLTVAVVALGTIYLLMISGGVGTPPAEQAAGAAEPAGEVEALVARLEEALGGRDAWEGTRFLRFRFARVRTHHWDRYTGRHRLDAEDQAGRPIVVLHNVQTREGRAWVDGEQLTGEALEERLAAAHRAWVNDTYWLLMPYKLRDPGVRLELDGREEIDGVDYHRLRVSFGSDVGLTPGDVYWAFLHPETGLMDYWEYVLEGREPPPVRWAWRDWQQHGDILLAPRRVQAGGDRELPLDRLAVLDELPDAVFEGPAPPATD